MASRLLKFTPKLRFAEFKDEWSLVSFGEVFKYEQPTKYLVDSTDYNDSHATPVLTAGKTFLLGYTNENNNIYKNNLPCIIFDDFTTASQYVDFPFKAKSSAMKILTANEGYNIKVLYEILKNIKYEIGGHERHWISKFSNILVNVPGKKEQQKIADFLTVLDKKIAMVDKKIDLLNKYKKASSQKIFSQQIRFKDENGNPYPDWESTRIGDNFIERLDRGANHERMLSVTINKGVVPFSSLDRKDNSSADKTNYKIVKVGDIAYNSMRMWQGASGVSKYNGIVSPAYTVITPTKNNEPYFWAYCFKTKKSINIFQNHSQGLTSDTWNLKFNSLSKIKFMTPQLPEQQKIADYLTVLDYKIYHAKKELEQARQFKKALSQRMFV